VVEGEVGVGWASIAADSDRHAPPGDDEDEASAGNEGVFMSTDRDKVYEKVETALRHIALHARPKLDPYGIIFNERYLHHEFSHRYQALFLAANQLIPTDEGTEKPVGPVSPLHPEWPTRKEVKVSERLVGGGYQGVSPVEAGAAGHIDFAVGPYGQPWLGIEFKLTVGWPGKAVGFDLVKLLDNRNQFKRVISFNLILRDRLSRACTGLQDRIAATYSDAVRRLREQSWTSPNGPELWYLVAEIAPTGRRFFQCRQTGTRAVMGDLEVATVRSNAATTWGTLGWHVVRT